MHVHVILEFSPWYNSFIQDDIYKFLNFLHCNCFPSVVWFLTCVGVSLVNKELPELVIKKKNKANYCSGVWQARDYCTEYLCNLYQQ